MFNKLSKLTTSPTININRDYTGVTAIAPTYWCKRDCTGVIAITQKRDCTATYIYIYIYIYQGCNRIVDIRFNQIIFGK